MNAFRRLALVGLMVIVGFVSVSAHMKLEKAQPAADAAVTAPPPHIQIWFTQKPDLNVSKMTLDGPSGAVELVQMHVMDKSLMATIKGSMDNGAYTVRWQTAGDDGHVQKGEYKFTLKRAQ
jgi:methionine-rich copper-binding protein CopC